MGFLQRFLGLELIERPPVTLSAPIEDAIERIINARSPARVANWASRIPSVSQALSVPAIHRAVVLISSTTGMLSMQTFRNGAVMDDPPRLAVRPDPDEAPGTFYQQTTANLAKHGEYVWWIASRDGDGNPAALVNVPLHELNVEPNFDDRRRSRYTWGSISSTRWTPTNPQGQFVHRKYALAAPFALRGEGPLQMAKAATSIAVEAQTWAANFYEGGKPRDIIKWSRELDPTPRDDMGELNLDTGLSEAERLKAQYIARDSNTPIIIDERIDSITHPAIDEQTAHLLNARLHIRGDAALMFGIPGHFVEYVQQGTSLTYQTLETAFTELIRVCLQPLYLEPIEQDMSDLLPRTTTARFNVKGFLRADVKTRFEVHGIAIDKGIYDAPYARKEEGIDPGDVEFAPVPFAPPQADTGPIRRLASDVRCPSCNKFLAKTLGPGSEIACPRCKELIRTPSEFGDTSASQITVNLPERMVMIEAPVTVHPSEIHLEPVFNAPAAAPMNVALATNMDLPLAGIAAATERLRDGLEQEATQRRAESEALTERLSALADSQVELARAVSAPKRRQISATRNDAGLLTDAVLIEESVA